jgi:hypothetical protein
VPSYAFIRYPLLPTNLVQVHTGSLILRQVHLSRFVLQRSVLVISRYLDQPSTDFINDLRVQVTLVDVAARTRGFAVRNEGGG